LARGLATAPLVLLRAAGAALRALDRTRVLALLVATGLVLSLLAPWYSETVTARGRGGTVHATQSFSGFSALSSVAIACVLLALVVWLWLWVRAGAVVSGLGADGRRAARGRTDGAVVALAGALGAVWLMVKLADHPGGHEALAGANTSVSVRWGLVLSLLLSIGLALCGGVIAAVRPAGRARKRPRAARDRDGRARTPHRRPRRAPGHPTAAEADPGELPMPDFDFAVSDEPVPITARRPTAGDPPARRTGASRSSG
jgi:hypothetical protein